MVRTIEKFKNVKLPISVRESIAKRYPNWAMAKDIYQVSYHSDKGVTKMQYKVRIENGKEFINVKIDGNGNFM